MTHLGRPLLYLGRSIISPSYYPLQPNHLLSNMIIVRTTMKQGFVRKQVRTPVRVYENDEQVPMPEKGRRSIKLSPSDQVAEEKSSVTIFNTVMGNISKNRERKEIGVEGARLIEEALLAGLKLEKLFILKSLKGIPERISNRMTGNVEIHKVGQKHMQVWSSLTAPPGLIGIFPKPKFGEIVSRSQAEDLAGTGRPVQLPMTVICDNLREPGNLGSLLRSAAGAGCKRILLSKGCVDPWDTKVLRGGCGAQFRVPIIPDIPAHALPNCIELQTHDPLTSDLDSVPSQSRIGIFLADSNCEDGRSGLPLLPYTAVDFTSFSQIYLIVGGETEGLGNDTLQIASSLNPSSSFPSTLARLHIPLHNQIESLNVANAFGVIAFEVQRQFSAKRKQDPQA